MARKNDNRDIVAVTCYYKTKFWDRKEAMAFYLEGMACSDGWERERYTEIYFQLANGVKHATDEVLFN